MINNGIMRLSVEQFLTMKNKATLRLNAWKSADDDNNEWKLISTWKTWETFYNIKKYT